MKTTVELKTTLDDQYNPLPHSGRNAVIRLILALCFLCAKHGSHNKLVRKMYCHCPSFTDEETKARGLQNPGGKVAGIGSQI
jgi:hypothetical protein